MADSLQTSFLGAIQASLSVLLVMSYGVIAAQFNLLEGNTTKQISSLCVRMFLPALLITNVGSQLHADTGIRYVPVFVWALLYTIVSMGLGMVFTRLFRLPSWCTPALCFNNTTSLPLLLVESLAATGILERLVIGENDSSNAALKRAQSYFLVNAVVSNSLTFALGPKLLDGEDLPNQQEDHEGGSQQQATSDVQPNGGHDVEDSPLRHSKQSSENRRESTNCPEDGGSDTDEQTSLLPDPVVRRGKRAEQAGYRKGREQWDRMPRWVRSVVDFSSTFLNPPLIGAGIGALLGLVPPLHKAFFNEPQEGGIFTAWMTDSVEKIGQLFAALQVVVVGVKLSSSLRKMKRGEQSGKVTLLPTVVVLSMRFVWMPVSVALHFASVPVTPTLYPYIINEASPSSPGFINVHGNLVSPSPSYTGSQNEPP